MKSTCVRSCIIHSVSFELHQFLRLRFLFSITAHCKCVLANLNKKRFLNCWIPFQNCVTHVPWFKLAFSCAKEINLIFSQKYLQCKTLHSFPFLPKGREKKSHKHISLYFPEIQCIFVLLLYEKLKRTKLVLVGKILGTVVLTKLLALLCEKKSPLFQAGKKGLLYKKVLFAEGGPQLSCSWKDEHIIWPILVEMLSTRTFHLIL